MTEMQLSIFSEPRARRRDPATSRAAARRATPTLAAILEVLAAGDYTAEEIAARLPLMRTDTVVSAVSRLKRAGKLEPTGEVRLSRAGCDRMVLRAVR